MAKTMYQQKRQFLNKINQRIKTLVSRAGVDKADIEALIHADGVWFTETGNLNMTTEEYSLHKEKIEQSLNKLIPSYLELREQVREQEEDKQFAIRAQARKDPTTKIDIPKIDNEFLHSKMRERFSYKNNVFPLREEYYAEIGISTGSDLTGTVSSSDLDELLKLASFSFEERQLLKQIKKDWSEWGKTYRAEGGIPNQELYDMLAKLREDVQKVKSFGKGGKGGNKQ